MLQDHQFMKQALELAEYALTMGEAPIGAIIIDENDVVLAKGYNQVEARGNPLAHAEIIALEDCFARYKHNSLSDCTLYVTLEPCLMCAGAILQARLKRIVYGAYSDKGGALSSVANVYEHKFGYSPMVRGGILESECAALMNQFGESLRQEGL